MKADRMSSHFQLLPNDRYNQELASNVFPLNRLNPEPASCYNLVVIGAGTAGLVTAAGAAGLGAKVALIERRLMGGDCLHFGCVPSKCLIRSSRAAYDFQNAEQVGIRANSGLDVDFSTVMERMRRLRAEISVHDSVERFEKLGVDVFLGEGRFSGPDSITVEGKSLKFRKAVIATGARPVEPAIDGIQDTGYLTNETIFNLTERPLRFAVIGGGPIGCELAQAFQRLGSQVTLIEKGPRLLVRENQDAVDLLTSSLCNNGIQLIVNAVIKNVSNEGIDKRIVINHADTENELTFDHILVGIGRKPNVEGLNLEGAGVDYDARNGIVVNDHLQTTNQNIYAAGDICLPFQYTHAADAAARLVIQNALFPLYKGRWSAMIIPRCVYTDPEIAHVGLTEQDAKEQGIKITTFTQRMKDIDRAFIDGDEDGFIKIHTRRGSDQILGATIAARRAGEMISELTLAMKAKIGLKNLSSVIHPYPTQAEAIKKAADAYNQTRLTPRLKKLLKHWFNWIRN